MMLNLEKEQTAIKDKIVKAMLPHVAFDGFTKRSLDKGIIDAGFSLEMGLLAFSGDMTEVAKYYSDWIDRQMVAGLKRHDLNALKVREQIAFSMRLRLELLTPYRETERRIIAYLSLPSNALVALKCVYSTVDTIWYTVGDTATDWNFYTKRGLLAGVYVSTLLYWLTDTSEEFTDTWEFLNRRIYDVLQIPKFQTRIKQAFEYCFNPLMYFRQLDI